MPRWLQHMSRWAAICLLVLGTISAASAQTPKFGELKLDVVASGEELASQPDLWVLEVYFKPMRQIVVELTDPKTGQKKPEYVWYLAYRAVNRKLASRTTDVPPTNELDARVLPPQFVPEFELVTTDGEVPQTYHDVVIPEALPIIARRERMPLKSSVNVVAALPAAQAEGGEGSSNVIYGVATWRGIDPEADRYTVFMTGFSNGLKKLASPNGEPELQRKTIVMKFWRPGDRYDLREPEIRIDPAGGEPVWMFR